MWLNGQNDCNEYVLFFSSHSSFSIHVVLEGLSVLHYRISHRELGLANHINLIPLDALICPAVGINKQIDQSPSLGLAYKHWGRKFYFLLGSAELQRKMWIWNFWQPVGSTCLQNEGKQIQAKRQGSQTKGLMGNGISVLKALVPATLLVLWTSPIFFSAIWVTELLYFALVWFVFLLLLK